MKAFKTLAIAATLTALPSLTLAMGCNYGTHEQQAQSCATGATWDADQQACVPVVNS